MDVSDIRNLAGPGSATRNVVQQLIRKGWPAALLRSSELPIGPWQAFKAMRPSKPRSALARSRSCNAWVRSPTSLIDHSRIWRGSACERLSRSRRVRASAAAAPLQDDIGYVAAWGLSSMSVGKRSWRRFRGPRALSDYHERAPSDRGPAQARGRFGEGPSAGRPTHEITQNQHQPRTVDYWSVVSERVSYCCFRRLRSV